MTEIEQRIRERAYQIWLDEGCPDGRDREHWRRACEEVTGEENRHAATLPNPIDPRTGTAVGGDSAEPMEAVENQGDFPTLTDQGEETSYPRPRNSRGGDDLPPPRRRQGRGKPSE